MLLVSVDDTLKFALMGDRLSDNYYRIEELKPAVHDFLKSSNFCYIIPCEPNLAPYGINQLSAIVALLTYVNATLETKTNPNATYRNFLLQRHITSNTYKRVYGDYVYSSIVNMLSDSAIRELASFIVDAENRYKEVLILPNEIIEKTRKRIQSLATHLPVLVPNDIDININIDNRTSEDPILPLIDAIMGIIGNVSNILMAVTIGSDIIMKIVNSITSFDLKNKVLELLGMSGDTSLQSTTDTNIANAINVIATVYAVLYLLLHQRKVILPSLYDKSEITTTVQLTLNLVAETPDQIIDNIYIPLAYLTTLASPIKTNLGSMVNKALEQNRNRIKQLTQVYNNSNSVTEQNKEDNDDNDDKPKPMTYENILSFLGKVVELFDRGPTVMQPLYVTVFIPGKIFIPFGMITNLNIQIDDDTDMYGGHPKMVTVKLTIEDLSNGHAVFATKTDSLPKHEEDKILMNPFIRKLPSFFGLLIYDKLKQKILDTILAEEGDFGIGESESSIIKVRGNILLTNTNVMDLRQHYVIQNYKPTKPLGLSVVIKDEERIRPVSPEQFTSQSRVVTSQALNELINSKNPPDYCGHNCFFSYTNKNRTLHNCNNINDTHTYTEPPIPNDAIAFNHKTVNGFISVFRKDNNTIKSFERINNVMTKNALGYYIANFNCMKYLDNNLHERVIKMLKESNYRMLGIVVAAIEKHLKTFRSEIDSSIKTEHILQRMLIAYAGEASFRLLDGGPNGEVGYGQALQHNTMRVLGITLNKYNRCLGFDPIVNVYVTTYILMEHRLSFKGYGGVRSKHAAANAEAIADIRTKAYEKLINNSDHMKDLATLVENIKKDLDTYTDIMNRVVDYAKRNWDNKKFKLMPILCPPEKKQNQQKKA